MLGWSASCVLPPMMVCSMHSATSSSVVAESPSVPDVAAVVSAVVPDVAAVVSAVVPVVSGFVLRVSSVVLSAVLLTAAVAVAEILAVAVKVRSAGLFPTYLCSNSEILLIKIAVLSCRLRHCYILGKNEYN
jgi:hypothetical protein